MLPRANLGLSRYEYAPLCLRMLKADLPSPVVFDIGPGDGRLRSAVEDIGLGWRGFDVTAWRDVVQWDIGSEPCPLDERAGAVLLLDVLEHSPNPGHALRAIAAALLPQGRLILTMPNPRWSAGRLHHLVFGTPSGFTKRDLDDNHHVFFPLVHVVERLLSDAGFVVDEYVTLDGKTAPFRARFSLLRMAIERLDPSACGMSYGIVARKAAA